MCHDQQNLGWKSFGSVLILRGGVWVSKAPLFLVLLPNGSGDGWERGFGRELSLSFLVMNLHACDGSMDTLCRWGQGKGKERKGISISIMWEGNGQDLSHFYGLLYAVEGERRAK